MSRIGTWGAGVTWMQAEMRKIEAQCAKKREAQDKACARRPLETTIATSLLAIGCLVIPLAVLYAAFEPPVWAMIAAWLACLALSNWAIDAFVAWRAL